MSKWVYRFGPGKSDGTAAMKTLLGGKGANLAEMCALGLPVPPGFTLSTEVCTYYTGHDRQYPVDLGADVDRALAGLEKEVGRGFGDKQKPLLVSVRSGARASMPGMMDTVLNLGLNDETVAALAKLAGDERFAFDSYRRFIQMYSDVVLGVAHETFEEILDSFKDEHGFTLDTELSGADWKTMVAHYKKAVEAEFSRPFPQNVKEQLWGAIGAVFGSWENARAKTYRKLQGIPDDWGTAVNVQAMVFGNLGDTSATGVAFTRNPSTGEKALYGEYLVNAQGEDVVAGIRTPQQITKRAAQEAGSRMPSLEELMPQVFSELSKVCDRLEAHYRDMQDVEFTVESGKLFMLQTRSGKRTAKAALKIAVDLANEGVLTRGEAIARVDPRALDQLLHPSLDPRAHREILATGLPASPGAACGEVVFTADDAERLAAQGRAVILVRIETSPEDIHGMHAAKGILTARGGMTSHAAVVARGMGRPCVSGAGALRIQYQKECFTAGGHTVKRGETITIDGATGQVILGEVPTVEPDLSGEFGVLMGWADACRNIRVRANAETVLDAETARRFGAEGIGLCRTEHMFFDEDRIVAVREMILAKDEAGRRRALEKILPMQRKDFAEIFRIMRGLPVTIRLLDPPLHEFLPKTPHEMAEVAAASGLSAEELERRAGDLEEVNPMLGLRGCRLGLTYPEIYEIQVRAIFEAAELVSKEGGETVVPEIMIPLVATRAEFTRLKERIVAVARAVGFTGKYLTGTMIELPRAALRAGEIAQEAEFFSFGTNDLTQTTFGISRDDAASFLGPYVETGILPADPFVTLDQDGVGELIRIAVERGRRARADLKLGICGEHGGDPSSIAFCVEAGLDYVSCSPYRVPIARLAAAQAELALKK
jgi:pyruvate,orthophosphate dikinase